MAEKWYSSLVRRRTAKESQKPPVPVGDYDLETKWGIFIYTQTILCRLHLRQDNTAAFRPESPTGFALLPAPLTEMATEAR